MSPYLSGGVALADLGSFTLEVSHLFESPHYFGTDAFMRAGKGAGRVAGRTRILFDTSPCPATFPNDDFRPFVKQSLSRRLLYCSWACGCRQERTGRNRVLFRGQCLSPTLEAALELDGVCPYCRGGTGELPPGAFPRPWCSALLSCSRRPPRGMWLGREACRGRWGQGVTSCSAGGCSTSVQWVEPPGSS